MRIEQAVNQKLDALVQGMWATGTVTEVGTGTPVTLTVDVNGGSLVLNKLKSYADPTVDDVVLVAMRSGAPIVIDAIG